MDDARSPSPAAKSPLIVLGPMALVLTLIGSCAAYVFWPRGERMGALDLRGDNPTLTFDVDSGDKLNFRMDTITVGTIGGYPSSSRSRTEQVRAELAASKISITAVGNAAGVKATTQCGAYAGKATTGSSDADSVKSSGHPLDCSLEIQNAGSYTLQAAVAWVPKDVRKAILEVRRERARK